MYGKILILTIAFLAVILSATAAAVETTKSNEFSFQSPAGFWGTIQAKSDASTSAAILSETGSFKIWLDEEARITETWYMQSSYQTLLVTGRDQMPIRTNEYAISTPGWIEISPALPASMPLIFHTTTSTEWSIPEFDSTAWEEKDSFRFDATYGTEFVSSYLDNIPAWPTSGVMMTSKESAQFEISALTPRMVGWTQASVKCHGVSPCIASDSHSQTKVSDDAYFVERLQVEIQNPGKLSGTLHNGKVMTTSTAWSLSGNMAARLPAASGPDCQPIGCDGEKTIRLDGDFTIDNLQKAGDDRFSASIQGDIQNLILDEQPVDPSLLWAVGAGTAAVTAVAWLAVSKLGLLGLFTRISAEEALEHPRREILYEYIVEHPGTTFREVVRKTGIPTGTTRHHLNVLRRCDLVVEKPHKATLRFFENHGKFDASWDTVVMLREEPLREVHDWLSEHPESPQKVIVAAMMERGHSRGTTQHRLKRLQDAYLVTYRQQGRLKLYTAHAEPQHPKPARMDAWNGLDASWPNPRP